MGVTRTRSEPEPRSPAEPAATLEDLYGVEGKAELIDGRIVRGMATGRFPNRIAFRIVRSLDDHARATGRGEAYTDSMGFAVARLRSGRESFSPDASFFDGAFPPNKMRFVIGPPTFAVLVRSENDRGPAAEREIAAKRADYFEAGTKVVWDVDPISAQVFLYRAEEPERARTFSAGQIADAEPAVPGWRIEVEQIFAG
jgi:Uma2 family endonuclease